MLRPVSVLLVSTTLLAFSPAFAQQASEAPAPVAPAEIPAPANSAAPASEQAAPAVPQNAAPASEQAAPAVPQNEAPPAEQAAPGQAGGAGPGNQFCNQDLSPLLETRGKIAEELGAINKRPKPKTFANFKRNFNDFCGRLSAYIANDRKIVDYMKKNKDFCALQDDIIKAQTMDLENARKTHAKICSRPPQEPVAPAAGGGGRASMPKPPVDLRLR